MHPPAKLTKGWQERKLLQGSCMSRIGRLTTLAVLFAAACQSSSATSPGDAGNLGEGDVTSTGDAKPEDGQPTSCTAPSDCIEFPPGPAIACCIGRACMYGQAAGTDSCVDASAQIIMASSYDQSCQKDSDCVAIEEGDFCQPGANNGCTNAAINRTALTQYQADLAKTTAGVCYGLTGCPLESGPCCQSGVCAVDGQCFDAVAGDASAKVGSADAGDASADAERNEAGDAGAE
jgi:hypothetical protein